MNINSWALFLLVAQGSFLFCVPEQEEKKKELTFRQRAILFAKGVGYAGLTTGSVIGVYKVFQNCCNYMKIDCDKDVKKCEEKWPDLVDQARGCRMVHPVAVIGALSFATCIGYINYKFKFLKKSLNCFRESWS